MTACMSLILDAEKYIFPLLDKYCGDYPYHNPDHTRAVHSRVIQLAEREWIVGDDLEDIELAALFHDIGFTKQYENNEIYGCDIADSWLREKGHPPERRKKIRGIIMATVLFTKPKNILEQIIQDADLENLGQSIALSRSEAYYRELLMQSEKKPIKKDYWRFVKKLFVQYHFHTSLAKLENEAERIRNIDRVNVYLK